MDRVTAISKITALLLLSHRNTHGHEMESAWRKAVKWMKEHAISYGDLGHIAQVAYAHGYKQWASSQDEAPYTSANQHQPGQQSSSRQDDWEAYMRRRRERDEQQQARRKAHPVGGETWRFEDLDFKRRVYAHTLAGSRISRTMRDRVVTIDCAWCLKTVEVAHYPGNDGKYCSPDCRTKANAQQSRIRMQEYRERKRQNKS